MNADKQLNLCIFLFCFNQVSPTDSTDPVSKEDLAKTAKAHSVTVIYSELNKNKHILY